MSLTFLGFSISLLSYYLTKNFLASLLSGFLVIFSPATLNYVVHIQVLEVYWVPLAILCMVLFLDTQKRKYLILSLACFLLQFYNSFLPAYFILFSCVILYIFKWFEKRIKIFALFSEKNLLLIVLAFLLTLPLVIPYFQVSREFHYVRDLRDSIHFALQPEDLLYPGDTTRLKSILLSVVPTNHYSQNNEFKPGYLVAIFSFLVLLSIVYLFIKRKRLNIYEKSFSTIAFLGLLLSFGPFLHLNRHTVHQPFPIPLPYALFYYIMPGFQ